MPRLSVKWRGCNLRGVRERVKWLEKTRLGVRNRQRSAKCMWSDVRWLMRCTDNVRVSQASVETWKWAASLMSETPSSSASSYHHDVSGPICCAFSKHALSIWRVQSIASRAKKNVTKGNFLKTENLAPDGADGDHFPVPGRQIAVAAKFEGTSCENVDFNRKKFHEVISVIGYTWQMWLFRVR